jgi:hypothetical protein
MVEAYHIIQSWLDKHIVFVIYRNENCSNSA